MNRSESDEEAAEVWRMDSCVQENDHTLAETVDCGSVILEPYHGLEKATERLLAESQALSRLSHKVPQVVPFMIGGRLFALHRSVLERDPQSLLCTLANEHYHKLSIEEPYIKRKKLEDKYICIASKSPEVFEKLANFLRGYTCAISAEWRLACQEDAEYYGLQHSWNQTFQRVSKNFFRTFSEMHFKESSLHSDYICAVVGDEMERGEHYLDLSSYGGNVGFGVVSCSKVDDDFSSMNFLYGIFYCTDGVVRSCSSSESLQRLMDPPHGSANFFERDADKVVEIRLSFDVDESIIQWHRLSSKGHWCIGIRRIPKKQKYRFGVLASINSRVFIKP